jgi:hypothetical protein
MVNEELASFRSVHSGCPEERDGCARLFANFSATTLVHQGGYRPNPTHLTAHL